MTVDVHGALHRITGRRPDHLFKMVQVIPKIRLITGCQEPHFQPIFFQAGKQIILLLFIKRPPDLYPIIAIFLYMGAVLVAASLITPSGRENFKLKIFMHAVVGGDFSARASRDARSRAVVAEPVVCIKFLLL